MKDHHQQVWVPEQRTMVDLELLPILQVLWAAGVRTFYSCQGGAWHDRWMTHGEDPRPGYLLIDYADRDLVDYSLFSSPASDALAWHRALTPNRYCFRFDPIGTDLQATVCCVPGCDSPIRSRDLCGRHYQRWRRFASPFE